MTIDYKNRRIPLVKDGVKLKVQIRNLCCLVFVSLSLTSVFAGDERRLKQSKPDPKSLIGKEVRGDKYPDGWVSGQWAMYAKDHNFVMLAKGKSYAFILEEPVKTGTSKTSIIVDAVPLKGRPKKDDWHDISTDCRGPTIPTDSERANGRMRFYAEVSYKKCERYSNNIWSAWQVDLQKNTISSRPTNGMRCGNTYLDSGEIPECKFIPKEW